MKRATSDPATAFSSETKKTNKMKRGGTQRALAGPAGVAPSKSKGDGRKSLRIHKISARHPVAGRKSAAAERARLSPRARMREALDRLKRAYPDAHIELDFRTPLDLVIATILSAQCTDKRVNEVTPILFRRYRTARAYAEADPEELKEIIKPTGFFNNKTKSIRAMARGLVERHGGRVPRTMEELSSLSGIGRKTANVILGNAFGIPGMVVDTHVRRVALRLGFTRQTDPVKIEADLQKLIPEQEWTISSHLFIFHGRRCCAARKPACERCPVEELCPSSRLRNPRPRW
jgi:endonuclease-3